MASDEKKTPAFRTLTPMEYGQAKRLYELGTATMVDLAEQFGIKHQSLAERFKRDGVVKGSRVAEALEKMDQAVGDTAEQMVQRIADTKEQHYKYAEALSKMTMQAILETRRDSKPLAAADGNLAALNKAARTLEVLRKERYKLLGLDEENGDPSENDEILITELNGEQIEQLREASRPNSDNSEAIDSLMDDIDIVEENLDGELNS